MSSRLTGRAALRLLLATLLLGGCMPDLKSERPPERIYWLEGTTLDAPPDVQPVVAVAPGLDTDRIWRLEADQRLNYYAGAFWPDNLRPLLASHMDRAFLAAGRGPELSILLERFFAVDRGEGLAPSVEVRALFGVAGERCVFEAATEANGARLRDIVAAHQEMLDALTRAAARTAEQGCS
ncbi:MAG: hypothetical protein AAGE43_04050 [Pseudomonadota bacterium]